jgi:hypothetical protein
VPKRTIERHYGPRWADEKGWLDKHYMAWARKSLGWVRSKWPSFLFKIKS